MSLFQFGFTRRDSSSVQQQSSATSSATVLHLPSRDESGLGIVEYEQVTQEVSDLADPQLTKEKRHRRGTYTKYSNKQRADIGKYALENGNERAIRHFSAQFPNLKESTVRNFKKAYKNELDKQRKQQLIPQPVTEIVPKPRGRPPILLELDKKLVKFLTAIRAKGGVVNIHVVRATAAALIKTNPTSSQHLHNFRMPRSWVQSLYKRMGLTKRAGTTSRPPVPQGLYDECRLEYLGQIDSTIKKYNIPPALILNSDQTPSSFVSVGKSTMAVRGERSIPIKGITDKRAITLNFVITMSNQILPMQVIYTGKTKASQPRDFTFPPGFSVTQNPKHWSNEVETLKLIDEIINPYIVKTRIELKLPEDQKALLIWDVFRAQMTNAVKQRLCSLHIECVYVPANMTHFFQPLDLTVNGSGKQFMRKQFVTYYSEAIRKQVDSGTNLEDVEVDFRLSVIKPLHAQWLVNLYNFLSSERGRQVIYNGWMKAGILGLLDGTTVLPPEDPFECIVCDTN